MSDEIKNYEVIGPQHVKQPIQKFNSVSGGKSSAYVYANYPAFINMFSLVLIESRRFVWMQGKDEKNRQRISDRLGFEFVGTAELDNIIYTILDLEQKFGIPITMVSGLTFEGLIRDRKGFLPSHSRRFCTSTFKVEPIFHALDKMNLLPITTRLGFRKGEESRMIKSMARLESDGFEYMYKRTTQKPNSRYFNREKVKYRDFEFPLIENGIGPLEVESFWNDKNVRFATHNNCIGCVNRSPIFLNMMSKLHPVQYQKFVYLESYADTIRSENGNNTRTTFRPEGSMQSFISPKIDFGLFESDFNDCDSGSCGL
jgi:hypothetical protein